MEIFKEEGFNWMAGVSAVSFQCFLLSNVFKLVINNMPINYINQRVLKWNSIYNKSALKM